MDFFSLHDLLSDVGIARGADDVESIWLGAALVTGTRMDKSFTAPRFRRGGKREDRKSRKLAWEDYEIP